MFIFFHCAKKRSSSSKPFSLFGWERVFTRGVLIFYGAVYFAPFKLGVGCFPTCCHLPYKW